MEQEWYFAEGEASVGPLSSDALIGALRRMAEPGRTLVWRAGLDRWQHAAEVPELAGRFARRAADVVAAPDPARDRWTSVSEAEVRDDAATPGAKRRWAHVILALALAVAIIGGATYASHVFHGPADGAVSVMLPKAAVRPPPPAKLDPAAILAQLTDKATQAAAATDAIALKLWSSIEPQTMQARPNLATASRADLESYLRDLKTAEANTAAVRQQYAVLLDAERGLIEEAARSSGLPEDGWNDLMAATSARHGKSLERVDRMLQARRELYQAMQATEMMVIDDYGKYKVDAAGHVRFSNKAAVQRALAATERVTAANQALDRIELEMSKAQWQPPEPAWKDLTIKEWTGKR